MGNNDGLEKISELPVEFIKEGTTFINRCTKPDAAGKFSTFSHCFHKTSISNFLFYFLLLEFLKIVRAVGLGFIVMGAIGYIVKLIHIPIRHLITV